MNIGSFTKNVLDMCRLSDKEYPLHCLILTQVSKYDATELKIKVQGVLFLSGTRNMRHRTFPESNLTNDQLIERMHRTYENIHVCYLKLLGKRLRNLFLFNSKK